MPTEVLLPSGLKGTIRELGIVEENLVSDPRLARSGKNLHMVFKNCWVETTEPGIYDFTTGFKPTALLQGDGLALLVLLRIETYGPEFLFDVNCPQCGTRISWELDLNEFMEANFKTLPEESKKILLEDNGIFKATLPKSKKGFTFRLVRLKDELKFQTARKESADRLSSALLDMVVVDFEGVEEKQAFLGLGPYSKRHKGPHDTLLSADANFIRQEIEEVGCGIDTQFNVECLQHGEVPVELPFQDNFLLPKRKKP